MFKLFGLAALAASLLLFGAERPVAVSAHAEYDLRFEFLIDRSATRNAFGEATQETKDGGRISRRKSDGRQFFESKLGASGKRQVIDLFFRDEQKHLVTAFLKDFGHCDAGKQMPASASA